jgi:hypothetical protein
MFDLTKYPRMAAMLARRDKSKIGKVLDHKPMRHIPEEWSFNDAGVRKMRMESKPEPVDNTGEPLPF